MRLKSLTAALIGAAVITTPITQAHAGGSDIVGGVIGGIIGGAIVNEANKKRSKRVYRKTTKSRVSSATRAANREVQTSLNYFGFPVGTVDGALGRRSRAAISQYQAMMGYPATGYLTDFERQFLTTSYARAQAGGANTLSLIAQNPNGARGLLLNYRDQLAQGGGQMTAGVAAPLAAGTTVVVAAPQVQAQPSTTTTTTVTTQAGLAAPSVGGGALPSFLGSSAEVSLASHCNTVSLLTNTNGGFTNLVSMSDPQIALNEQFCLARTYAIARGEEMAAKIQGFSQEQIAQQCQGLGQAPGLKEHVAAVSLKPHDEVISGVSSFVLQSGMAPAQLSGTAKICLSVGYRKDDMDVALASSLLLVALGEQPYGELLGHHLNGGFGASKRQDLALAWYGMGTSAIERGQPAVFAPGQPERAALIKQATMRLGGGAANSNAPVQANAPAAGLPMFSVDQ